MEIEYKIVSSGEIYETQTEKNRAGKTAQKLKMCVTETQKDPAKKTYERRND